MTISVFISYSHDSDSHRQFVRSIADQLRADGLNCQIDQYINGFPAEGWQRWMEMQVEQADFVLLVCTKQYLHRYRGQAPDGGRGVNFEGLVISQTLYDHYYRNTKFIPVIPEVGSLEHVPLPLKGYSTYALPRDYMDVYRVLTAQHATPAPEIGEERMLGSTPENSGLIAKAGTQGEINKAMQAERKEESGTVNTMKVAYLGIAVALIVAIIAGLFALLGTPNVTVSGSDCAYVNTGSASGSVKQDCGEKDENQ